MECEQTQEVLRCHLKGKGLIRKSPYVTVCTADLNVGGSFLLMIFLVWLVVCYLGFFGCFFFGGEGSLAISGKYLVNTFRCYNLNMLLINGEFLCYKLVSGTVLASRLQSFSCLGVAVTEYFLCFHWSFSSFPVIIGSGCE